MRFFLVLILIIPLLSACTKDPGKGGLATITGRVLELKLDGNLEVIDTSSAVERRVYISYGDNTWVDDDTRTSFTGEYAFKWLQKGSYTIWVISDCNGCPDRLVKDVITISVDEKKGTETIRDLIYYND